MCVGFCFLFFFRNVTSQQLHISRGWNHSELWFPGLLIRMGRWLSKIVACLLCLGTLCPGNCLAQCKHLIAVTTWGCVTEGLGALLNYLAVVLLKWHPKQIFFVTEAIPLVCFQGTAQASADSKEEGHKWNNININFKSTAPMKRLLCIKNLSFCRPFHNDGVDGCWQAHMVLGHAAAPPCRTDLSVMAVYCFPLLQFSLPTLFMSPGVRR